jgi:hypothetical protein
MRHLQPARVETHPAGRGGWQGIGSRHRGKGDQEEDKSLHGNGGFPMPHPVFQFKLRLLSLRTFPGNVKRAAADLFPLVYKELRRIAAR